MVNLDQINNEYQLALNLANSHYENFPVASVFIPKRLRKHVAIIYKFARMADDIADEGNESSAIKKQKLMQIENEFISAIEGKSNIPFYVTLANTVKELSLTYRYLLDLLKAFSQDLDKKRYSDLPDLLNYCKYSANPVGRLILELFDIRDKKAYEYSDSICTALQITNFLQDISIDIQKDRVYIPGSMLKKFNLTENVFFEKNYNENFKLMMIEMDSVVRNMFNEGKNLLGYLPFRLKLQISLTIKGGLEILNKISSIEYNTLYNRPSLSKIDFVKILFKHI